MKYKVTNREAVGKIARREDFSNSTGSLTGKDLGIHPTGARFGWLPEWADRELSKVGRAFVVFSYNTPIGWFDYQRSKWVVPAAVYSNATSRHQGLLRRAIGDSPGEYLYFNSVTSEVYQRVEWKR